jgi:hypothetical protein
MNSTLTKDQKKVFGPKVYSENGHVYRITAHVRYDDQCGNGRNSFSITGEIEEKRLRKWVDVCGGCIHDQIAKHFPHLVPFIKWHLTSSDGPMHYIENSMYWAGKRGYCNGQHNSPPNLEHFKSCAAWPDAKLSDLVSSDLEQRLIDRLPELMDEFQKAMIELEFEY